MNMTTQAEAISPALQPYLENLESRIDPAEEERLEAEWQAFLAGGFGDELFSPARARPAPARIDWPSIHINDAIDDYESMALSQLAGVSGLLERGGGAPLSVRCNYGTGILPSLFNAELFTMPGDTNTLPTTRPLTGGHDAIRTLLDKGVPPFHAGLGEKVFAMAGRFQAIRAAYPKIGRYVHLYHPDMQGAIDGCELLWGSDLFLDLYEEPELVHACLELISDTYIAFMRKWFALVPAEAEVNVHWQLWHKGRIMLRLDSGMNLSPAMFDEFIAPYEQRLFDAFGGGAVHFCGRGDHYIEQLCSLRGMNAVNLSQPHLNDMETIYRHTVDRGIPLLSLHHGTAEAALAAGRDLKGLVHAG